MTTINNIADLVRILKEQPEWTDTIRSILLSQELLELPARFAEFVQLTQENNRLTNDRLSLVETRMENFETRMERLESVYAETNQRLNRLEGRFGNFEGSEYERKVRTRALYRTQYQLGLNNAYLALTQDGLVAPQLNSAIAQALGNNAISIEQSIDLHETDIIISDPGNRHVVVEISLIADEDDILRAKRRASTLNAATGGPVTPVVITAILNEAQKDQAAIEEVTAFLIPYP